MINQDNFQKRANIIFLQIVMLGISFLVFLYFLAAKLYPHLVVAIRLLLTKAESICGCTNHLSFTNHPFIFTASILLAAGFVTFFLFFIIKTIRLKKATRQFILANLKNRKRSLTLKLKKVSQSLGLKERIIEIKEEKPTIFCFNFVRPKICISSGLVKKLTTTELLAVLRHEQHHLYSHEPLKLFVIKTVIGVLFFLPGLKLLSKQYSVFSELAADEKATNNFQNRVPIASALYKIMSWEEQLTIRRNLAISFFGAVTEERINKLADKQYNPRLKISSLILSISIFLLLSSPLFLGGLFSFSKSVMISDTTFCHIKPSKTNHRCQWLVRESACEVDYVSKNSCG